MSDRKILNKIISFALKWVVRIKADSSLLTTDRYYKWKGKGHSGK